MPRPPSKHGLERKYKPWRRGKSKVAKKSNSSLKNKLRGKERLLAKLAKEEVEARAELEESIRQLKEEMVENQEKERERKNAAESHGTRFLERQRLTRMERTTRKLWETACQEENNNDKERYEEELRRIALDQVYVAHYSHDVKYQPLFRKGVRMVDKSKAAGKRASLRQRMLQQLANNDVKPVKWMAPDQYKRLPKDWTVDMEIATFGVAADDKSKDGVTASADNRFALNQQHSALLEAAEKLESALDEHQSSDNDDDKSYGDDQSDASDSDDDSSSDSDEADPLQPQNIPEKTADATSPPNSSSDDDNSSSSSSSDDDNSSSSSSSSSDDSSDEEGENVILPPKATTADTPNQVTTMPQEEVEDDFLVPVVEDEPNNVFESAMQHLPAWDHSKGDKSQGWATQRQRPDQRKRRRTRR